MQTNIIVGENEWEEMKRWWNDCHPNCVHRVTSFYLFQIVRFLKFLLFKTNCYHISVRWFGRQYVPSRSVVLLSRTGRVLSSHQAQYYNRKQSPWKPKFQGKKVAVICDILRYVKQTLIDFFSFSHDDCNFIPLKPFKGNNVLPRHFSRSRQSYLLSLSKLHDFIFYFFNYLATTSIFVSAF